MTEPTDIGGKSWRCCLCDEIHEGNYPKVCKSCERDGPFSDVELDRLKGRKKDGQHDCYSCINLGNPKCPNPEVRPSSSACSEFLGAPVKYNNNTFLRITAHVFRKVGDYSFPGFTCFRPDYTISRAEIGEGNSPIFIISDGEGHIPLGDQRLCLAPLGIDDDLHLEIINDDPPSKPSEYSGISAIAKDGNLFLGAKEKLSTKDLWSEICEAHQLSPILFKEVPPITQDELEGIENWPKLLDLMLSDGLEKDPLLLYCFKADIPIFDPTYITPEIAMQFAPHKLLITPTKVGKSFTAKRVGKVYERPSVGGMLGFATADRRHQGKLHNEIYPVSIDEIGDTVKDNEEVAHGLSSFLETGRVDIPRGLGVSVWGYSTLNFMSNPATHNDHGVFQVDLLDRFRDTINKLSTNYQALGSRLALIVFRGKDGMISRSGTPVNDATQLRLKAILQTVQVAYKRGFTSLFSNKHVVGWLHEPMPQHYVTQVDRFIKSSTPFEVGELLEGHKEGIKHMRGMSVRLAWMDFLPTYINTQEIDENEILERANTHLDRIFKENLISFQEITNAFSGDIQRAYNEALIQNLQPEYNSILIRCVLNYWKDREDSEQSLIPIEALHDCYIPIRSDDSPYSTFNKLTNAVKKNKSKVNQEMRRFGLHLTELGNDMFGLRVLDPTFLDGFVGKTGKTGKGSDVNKHGNNKKDTETGNTHITHITHQEGEIKGKTGKTGNGSETERKIDTSISQSDIISKLKQNWDYVLKNGLNTPENRKQHFTILVARTTNQLIKEHGLKGEQESESLKTRVAEQLRQLITQGVIFGIVEYKETSENGNGIEEGGLV